MVHNMQDDIMATCDHRENCIGTAQCAAIPEQKKWLSQVFWHHKCHNNPFSVRCILPGQEAMSDLSLPK